MLFMSLLGWIICNMRPVPVPDSFEQGFQDGFREMAVCRSIISALLFAVVCLRHRTRFTIVGTACMLILAVMQWNEFAKGFVDDWDALRRILPILAYSAILSPLTWVKYLLTYRTFTVGSRRIPVSARVDELNS